MNDILLDKELHSWIHSLHILTSKINPLKLDTNFILWYKLHHCLTDTYSIDDWLVRFIIVSVSMTEWYKFHQYKNIFFNACCDVDFSFLSRIICPFICGHLWANVVLRNNNTRKNNSVITVHKHSITIVNIRIQYTIFCFHFYVGYGGIQYFFPINVGYMKRILSQLQTNVGIHFFPFVTKTYYLHNQNSKWMPEYSLLFHYYLVFILEFLLILSWFSS